MTTGAEQGRLAAAGGQNLRLFPEHFYAERLTRQEEFRSFDAAPLLAALTELWTASRAALEAGANEAQTEEEFIKPVLEALGFRTKVQAGFSTAAGRRQPDYALFTDRAARDAAATQEGTAAYRGAVAVADAKRFDRALQGPDPGDPHDPVAQIGHYITATRRRWGILTNGRLWRLYAAAGNLLEGACYEVDLVELIELGDAERFREFAFFFAASSFREDQQGASLLDRLLDQSIAVGEQLGESLQAQVFEALPEIAAGLIGDGARTRAALDEAFEHGLVFLYRLLFCLHAEDRGLLPVDSVHYREYSLRKRRRALAADLDSGRTFSRHSSEIYDDLRALFRIVDRGDDDLGVNRYNGGLFSADEHPYFEGRSVPDPALGPALDRLYRASGRQVDFRDLATRHLGTIYERLLAYRLEADEESGDLILGESERRKYTGAYFTPQPVVEMIVERTLEPVLLRRSQQIADAGLASEEALERFLELRVLDPAMGSGHFLVAAAAYIAQFIATDPSYDGGLSGVELQRRVAERCIYGVDLIPMAAELANFSLWLATVKGDEPLTYLSNLRVGDSLVGVSAADLAGGGGGFFADRLARDAEAMLAEIGAIESGDSSSAAQVDAKRGHVAVVEALRGPLVAHARESIESAFPGEAKPMFHWPLEFPEVFLAADGRPAEARGFDAIVGNPPYIRIQELGARLAAYCRDTYESAHGAFDAYIVFIERALSLLAPQGRLGFVVPNKFAKLESGAKLRQLLARDRAVEEIIDFGDAQVFAGATNYTCILILDRAAGGELAYRRLPAGDDEFRAALNDPDRIEGAGFAIAGLTAAPWVLLAPAEQAIYDRIALDSITLEEACESIFTGLQTSADPVYIVEDRGYRGPNRLVYSKASGRELEIEPGLLHPLASGGDVERYAFKPLDSLLLFPYRRLDGAMELVEPAALARLPLTRAYLAEHEEALRGRERGRMDHDGWVGYVYPKSLGKHDLPKLGCAATVANLEIACDPAGTTYFHNVRVNGILPAADGPGLWTLLLLLNARLLDWVFRRGSVDHANGYFAANKQFIAPLPIRLPAAGQLGEIEALARRAHDAGAAAATERARFLDWLGGRLGRRLAGLAGTAAIQAYDRHSLDELLGALRKNRGRPRTLADSRRFREDLGAALGESSERLRDLRADLGAAEATANDLAYDLYELSAAQRAAIDAEYR